MKQLTCTFIICFVFALNLQAQTQRSDSLAMVSKANTDAEKFKLNKTDLKQFRKHRADYMLQYSPNRNPIAGPPNIFKTPVTPAGVNKMRDGYNHVDYTSDYFKPTKTTTKDSTLLSDSVYVKAFRDAAYKNTTKRRTAGHYIAIFGGVAVGIGLIVGFLLIAASMG